MSTLSEFQTFMITITKNRTVKELAIEMVKANGIDPRDDLMMVENYIRKIYRWTNGRSIPKAVDVLPLAKVTGTDVIYLISLF